jgi:phosphocarrier protein HPr
MCAMIETTVTIREKVGLHARPAADLVQLAAKLPCRITVEAGGKKADAKSILQVMALGIKFGQDLTVRADGEGEAAALEQIVALLGAEQ